LRATRPRVARAAKAAKAATAPVVVRIHETTGSAASGWDAALKAAVKSARAEVEPIAVEIVRQWADVSARGLARYHMSVKVAYRQALAPPKRQRKSAR
jgi:flavin-binding protein dodecin